MFSYNPPRLITHTIHNVVITVAYPITASETITTSILTQLRGILRRAASLGDR